MNMGRPVRVLTVIANPVDLVHFDHSGCWNYSARPFQGRADIVIERPAAPTENELRRSLQEQEWDIVHFVAHAEERRAANYASIALEGSDRRSRKLTGQYLAALLATGKSVMLVMLQACEPESECLDTLAEALVEHDFAVIVAPALSGVAQERLVLTAYTGGDGRTASDLANDLRAAWLAISPDAATPRVFSKQMGRAVFPDLQRQIAVAAVASPAEAALVRALAPTWQEELKRKRESGQFDVFLCHNGADKPAVMRIGHQLKEAKILPWLDLWELPPGQPWQPLLEEQLHQIKSAAVFVGAAGMGPWQEQEMYGFLRQFVRRRLPVIPVLLPHAPSTPELPAFLEAMTWVDFRVSEPDPLHRLIWGITGRNPDS